MYPRDRTLRLLTLTTTTVVVWILFFAPGFRWQPTVEQVGPFGNDFLQEWVGGRTIIDRQAHQLYDSIVFDQRQHDKELVGFTWSKSTYFPPVYPPPHYLVSTAIAWMPYRIAVYVWMLVLGTSLVGCAWIGLKSGELLSLHDNARSLKSNAALHLAPPIRLTDLNTKPDVTGQKAASNSSTDLEANGQQQLSTFANYRFIVALLPICPAVFYSLLMGQKGTLWMFIVAAALLLQIRRRSLLSGLCFGLLSIKPTLFFLLPIFAIWHRDRSFFLGAATTTAILWGTTAILLPVEVWSGFLSQVKLTSSYASLGGYHLEWSCNLMSLAYASNAADVQWLKWSLVFPLVIYVLFVSFASYRWSLSHPRDWFVALTATMLISPHAYFYDLAILCVPLLAMLKLEPKRALLSIAAVSAAVIIAADFMKLTGVPLIPVILVGLLAENHLSRRMRENFETPRVVDRTRTGDIRNHNPTL